MKIAIIGDRERAGAWEQHLRKLSVVREVLISTKLIDADEASAAILIDDHPSALQLLYDAIKKGIHTYLVSRLPTDLKILETIYHTSEEANVIVQFSHWPSISPSTQWIRQEIQKPDLIQIKKEVIPLNHMINQEEFEHQWVDELAFIIKWMGRNIHRIEARPVRIGGTFLGLNITLRFEDSSLASVQFSAAANREMHQRIFSNKQAMADCDVLRQKIRFHRMNDYGRISTQEKTFDPSQSAERSVIQFIKSIQTGQPAIFTPYDCLNTARALSNIRAVL